MKSATNLVHFLRKSGLKIKTGKDKREHGDALFQQEEVIELKRTQLETGEFGFAPHSPRKPEETTRKQLMATPELEDLSEKPFKSRRRRTLPIRKGH